ncbi:hypothetical protein NECAME_06113 [Necator americanus]|uniref:Uncharacterized protein n=1 Tax=Necator americanus TaxID=51031 RepID=W2TW15_NECAM|nr:hypothetical protein NECAME_06113 [Necator americanus]ETN86038.1 hypothetical protein NECAME_06113 [Necator americanus]
MRILLTMLELTAVEVQKCEEYFQVSSRTLDSPHVTKTLSGCVSVVHQPFDLPKLLLRSERCLVILPSIENAPDLLLLAIHEELSSCFDACFLVEDVSFWTQVAPLVRLMGDFNAELPGMVCRVYMREESPWVLSIIVVPATVSSIEVLGGVPLLFCICDEPILANDLAKRRTPKSPLVLDWRLARSSSEKSEKETTEIEPPSMEWVSSTRCLEVLKENYKPERLTDVINDVYEVVICKAVVSALYTAVQSGVAIDHAVVHSILNEQCECTSLEVDGVRRSLKSFCFHLNPNAKASLLSSLGRSPSCIRLLILSGQKAFNFLKLRNNCNPSFSYCGDDKVQLSFGKILLGSFKQVPGLPYYYYTPQQ